MNTITFNLKREYFEAIKSGKKKFEFRLFDKWFKRLYDKEGNKKHFDRLEICLGYPKRGDRSRRITLPWKGFLIKNHSHPIFGDDEVKVFAIRANIKDEI